MEPLVWSEIFKRIHDYHQKKHSNPSEDYQMIRDLIKSRRQQNTLTHSFIYEEELTPYIQQHGTPSLKRLFTQSEPTIQDQIAYLKNHVQFLNEIIEECRQTLNKTHI